MRNDCKTREIHPHTNVTHCGVVRITLHGRHANQLIQYIANRYFAELHSAALESTTFSGDNGLGAEPLGAYRLYQWPPVVSESYWADKSRKQVSTPVKLRSQLEDITPSYWSSTWFFERADILYGAMSLAWDLNGDSLIGSGYRNPSLLLSEAAVIDRSARWSKHREQCGSIPNPVTNIHPWVPDGVRDEATYLLDLSRKLQRATNKIDDTIKLDSVLSPVEVQQVKEFPPGLLDMLIDPEGTIVIHLRIGDMWENAVRQSMARAARKHRVSLPEWSWLMVEENYYDVRPPEGPGPWNIANHAPPDIQIAFLEYNAATNWFSVPPFSYFEAILEGTRGEWRKVHIVTEWASAHMALVTNLRDRYNATV